MALNPEMQAFATALANEFRTVSHEQQRELVREIEMLLDTKLAKINQKIDALEKSVGGVIHEQRQQKRMLSNHSDQLARGDEEFKRLREMIKQQHELTLIALQQRGTQPANTVSVNNQPGVEAHQEATTGNLLHKAVPVAIGGGLTLAIYKLLVGG